jgi:hypothetical protein
MKLWADLTIQYDIDVSVKVYCEVIRCPLLHPARTDLTVSTFAWSLLVVKDM